jgi:hypothetical protein
VPLHLYFYGQLTSTNERKWWRPTFYIHTTSLLCTRFKHLTANENYKWPNFFVPCLLIAQNQIEVSEKITHNVAQPSFCQN